jgi:hypothetical protein
VKFRSDFVTNSSSSSFVTVRLYSEAATIQYQSPDVYWEEDSIEKMLRKVQKCKTMEELMKTLQISPDDVLWYSNSDTITMDELTKVRIASGYILHGYEVNEAIADGEIDDDSVFDDEGRVLEGTAYVRDMKTKKITPDKIDADDGYGV